MKSILKNIFICFIGLILTPIFCLSQKHDTKGWDWASDTLTYKSGRQKVLFTLARRAENYNLAYKSHWVDEHDWKTVAPSDTVCYTTCFTGLKKQADGSYIDDWEIDLDSDDVWGDIFRRNLGNAFWTSWHPRNSARIMIRMEKGSKNYGCINRKTEEEKLFCYEIRCTKVRKWKSDTARKLCVFKFYRGYNRRFNSPYEHFLPFPSGKLVYLHNIGFIYIKSPKQKSFRLKSINGYPWRKYISKINPNYQYFCLKNKKYLY